MIQSELTLITHHTHHAGEDYKVGAVVVVIVW